MSKAPWDAMGMAVVAVGIAVGAWHWRSHAVRIAHPPSTEEPWQQVRERYPTPSASDEAAAEVPDALLQGIVKANPFSPERHRANQPPEEATPDAKTEPAVVPPKFVYKGHLVMGAKQRAIVEDVNTKKTHFLQVGQEVAGFKVLDITEQQVILSDPQSSEPITLTLTPKDSSAAQ